jgi:hypothetical protein
MEPLKRFSLCPECGACPTIEFYDEGVRIGEEGNFVWLKREEWNKLVELIKKEELKEL